VGQRFVCLLGNTLIAPEHQRADDRIVPLSWLWCDRGTYVTYRIGTVIWRGDRASRRASLGEKVSLTSH
jgi:hypothetical protein